MATNALIEVSRREEILENWISRIFWVDFGKWLAYSLQYNVFWLVKKIVVGIKVHIYILALWTILNAPTFFHQIDVLLLIISIFIYTTSHYINIFLFNLYTISQSIKSFLILDKYLNATFKLDYTLSFRLFYI